MKHEKSPPFPIKKRSLGKIYGFTKGFVLNTTETYVTAEKIAKEMQVKVHLVRQALHKLNLEGLVGKKQNRPPHDSTRDRWGGWDSSWRASTYEVLKND
jgi:transcription initiation factor IIE alpha subunit